MPYQTFNQENQCPNCHAKHTLLHDERQGTLSCVSCGLIVKRGICDFTAPPNYKDNNGAFKNNGTGQKTNPLLSNAGVGVSFGSLGPIGKSQSLENYHDQLVVRM
jgi:transcription initiation factor TFIIIB Brf1 subunit/transcription initiation factor TFIIB